MNEAKPIDIPLQQIEDLYQFAIPGEQVNWQAQYKPNYKFLSTQIPLIRRFLDRSIRQVTYNPSDLKAVVGLSGGLDSVTTALLIAQTMKKEQDENTVQNTSLVLVGFRGMSEEDYMFSRKFADYIGSQYPNLPIDFYTKDLHSNLTSFDADLDQMIATSGKTKTYSGELATRLMATYLMEFGDRTNHAVADTTNGTEIILGEIVINGGGEYAPLADLYKSQVFDIAEIIGVPDFIINRDPINSTFGHNKVRSYFSELPNDISSRVAYRVLDPILYYLYEKKYNPKTVARLLGHTQQFIQRVNKRVNNQSHRRDVPYFALNDRRKFYKHENSSVTNTELLKELENSLSITI